MTAKNENDRKKKHWINENECPPVVNAIIGFGEWDWMGFSSSPHSLSFPQSHFRFFWFIVWMNMHVISTSTDTSYHPPTEKETTFQRQDLIPSERTKKKNRENMYIYVDSKYMLLQAKLFYCWAVARCRKHISHLSMYSFSFNLTDAIVSTHNVYIHVRNIVGWLIFHVIH